MKLNLLVRKALQSGGYNVYMYLDDHLIDTYHLCCMTHARVKFTYALEQGGDLMDKAFRYFDTFWNQLFVYLKDGHYRFDNSLAEHFVYPLADERKNSQFLVVIG